MAKQATKKQRNKHKVNSLTTAISYQGESDIPTSIELITYDIDSLSIDELPNNTIPEPNSNDANSVTWLKTKGLSNGEYINKLCRSYGLHSFDIRDLMSFQHVVKVAAYEEVTFILIPVFTLDSSNECKVIQTGFILGNGFVVSMQEAELPILEEVKSLLENKTITARKKNTPDVLLYTLLNAVNAQNLTTILKMEDRLLDIEDLLIVQDNSGNTMTTLRQYRINYIKIKRVLLSIREEYNNLLRNSNKLINEDNIVYFNDFDDKIRTSLSDLETCHELLSSLLDLYYSNTNLRMNEIMKRLTIVSTIFIPLTFLVGVWGMNFKFMPELHWQYGYLAAWGVFGIIVVVVLYLMKWKKWF